MSSDIFKNLIIIVLVLLRLTQECDMQLNTNHSAVRQTKAKELSKYLDTAVDPCENFYDFACGNWARAHPVNVTHQIESNALYKVQTDVESMMQTILSDGKQLSERPTVTKVKDFYKSCLKLHNLPPLAYRDMLRKVISEFGPMPAIDDGEWKENTFDWLQTVANISHKYHIQIIMGYFIAPDSEDRTMNRLTIGYPAFGLQRPSMYLDAANAIHLNRYRLEIVDNLMDYLELDEELAYVTATEIVNFEVELVKGIDNSTSAEVQYTTVRALHKKYAPHINMKRYIHRALGAIPLVNVIENSPAYHQNLIRVIKATPKRVVANYIYYTMIKNFLITPIPQEFDDFKARCSEMTRVHFPDVVDYLLYRWTNTREAERMVGNMFYDLKTIFEIGLQSNQYQWIAQKPRALIMKKLKEMKLEVKSFEFKNFSDDYGQLIIDPNNLTGNLQAIFARKGYKARSSLYTLVKPDYSSAYLSYVPKYIHLDNVLIVPTVALQPYLFWSASYPNALNLGQMGFLLAREMMHVVIDKNINWWDNKTLEIFENREQCFKNQYNGFAAEYNGLRESLADHAALRMVFQIYSSWLKSPLHTELKDDTEKLANLPYEGEKLFFISFAQLWCTDRDPAYSGLTLPNDDSAPGDLKVMTTLSHIEEFSKVFQCQSGGPMNPTEKCVFL